MWQAAILLFSQAVFALQSTPNLKQQSLSTKQTFAIQVSASSMSDLSEPNVPSTKELLKFALPTLGVWFLQPVLSLIDSGVIGRSQSVNSVAELAALGPGIAWCDSTAYAFQFMGMATTILLNKGFISKDEVEVETNLSHAIFTALGFGIALAAMQYTFAEPAIKILAGSSTELIPLSIKYSRIRSFGAIFAIPTIVAQSAFLACKDASVPLQAVLFGALFNLLGDVILVTYYNQGIGGAAIATFLSQLGGFLYLMCVGWRRLAKYNQVSALNLQYLSKYIRIPSIAEALKFITFSGPLFLVLCVKVATWTYTTYAVSLSGTFHVAAHQILINFFLLFCVFGDVISQLSQTYLPPFLLRQRARFLATKLKGIISAGPSDLSVAIKRIQSIAVVVGCANTAASFILSRYSPQYFTKSKEVIQAIMKISPYLILSVFPNCMMAGKKEALRVNFMLCIYYLHIY
jgi:Na+-driven multidrug efflux pump